MSIQHPLRSGPLADPDLEAFPGIPTKQVTVHRSRDKIETIPISPSLLRGVVALAIQFGVTIAIGVYLESLTVALFAAVVLGVVPLLFVWGARNPKWKSVHICAASLFSASFGMALAEVAGFTNTTFLLACVMALALWIVSLLMARDVKKER